VRLTLVILSLAATAVPMRAAPSLEYRVKAVFLFNFAQFVDWPPEAFANAESPLVIGVLGNDSFDGILDEAVRGEKAHGRQLIVRRYRQVQDIGVCHVLFISPVDEAQLPGILSELRGRSILTVGESEGFAKAGGIIRFMSDRGRIHLRINVAVAREANLRLSSKLLRPAEIVDSGKD
jgi:hypothetical protein